MDRQRKHLNQVNKRQQDQESKRRVWRLYFGHCRLCRFFGITTIPTMGDEPSDSLGYFDPSRTSPDPPHPLSSEPLATDGTTYTMIYPIRSLLSEVQPSSTPTSPEPRESATQWLHTVPGAENLPRRNPSIQQRRTAQWQANISSRVSSGNISTPNSPRSRPRSLSESMVEQTDLQDQEPGTCLH